MSSSLCGCHGKLPSFAASKAERVGGVASHKVPLFSHLPSTRLLVRSFVCLADVVVC